MTALDQIRRLWAHAVWANDIMVAALAALTDAPMDAVRELAHVFGAEEIWLSRLEERPSTLLVWPALTTSELGSAARANQAGYSRFLGSVRDDHMSRSIAYTNTAGRSFETPIGEILLHVALHGQYHRGKVNLLLRQSGASPAPVDYIAFQRGVPAAIAARP